MGNWERRWVARPSQYTARARLTPTLGFTFDTVLSLLKYTAFDPRKTVPLLLAALYTSKGQELVAQRPEALVWLKRFVYGGLFFKIKSFLDQGVANNWKNDRYNWSREIVAVTGGSDGIGAKIVQMLASKGIKTVVLDIQEPKYIRESLSDLAILVSFVLMNVNSPTKCPLLPLRSRLLRCNQRMRCRRQEQSRQPHHPR